MNYSFGIRSVPPCSDCWEDGQCSMNCGPSVPAIPHPAQAKAMADPRPVKLYRGGRKRFIIPAERPIQERIDKMVALMDDYWSKRL